MKKQGKQEPRVIVDEPFEPEAESPLKPPPHHGQNESLNESDVFMRLSQGRRHRANQSQNSNSLHMMT